MGRHPRDKSCKLVLRVEAQVCLVVNETKSHGVRQLVTAPELLAAID